VITTINKHKKASGFMGLEVFLNSAVQVSTPFGTFPGNLIRKKEAITSMRIDRARPNGGDSRIAVIFRMIINIFEYIRTSAAVLIRSLEGVHFIK
jgi:hypothetical protein